MIDVLIIFFYYFFVKWFVYWLLVDHYDYLPNWLNHKPFNCSDCLQTHMLWIGYCSIAYILQDIAIFYGGFGLSILNLISIIYNRNYDGE